MNQKTRKVLKSLLIVQEKEWDITTRKKFGGKEYHYKRIHRRFNPFNPLTYVFLAIVIILGVILFGFVGFNKEVQMGNPFKFR